MQLRQLADSLDLTLRGDANLQINALAPVSDAGPSDLTFVVGRRYLDALRNTGAGAVIVPEALVDDAPCSCLLSANPYLSYAQASQLLYPEPVTPAGVADSAVVSPDAILGEGVIISPYAVVEEGVSIGKGTFVGVGVHLGRNCQIGAECTIKSHVTIAHDCILGDRCRLQPGAVIGADGFGYAPDKTGWVAIRQVGRVVIGSDVEIGANTTIDRGALSDTVIEDGVILDNQIQIGHNVKLGKYTAIAACVGIAGSTTIGERCTIGGKSAIVGHLTIADNVHLTATSFVVRSIKEAGSYSSGMPLQKTSLWRRTYMRLGRLEELARAIKKH
ncbi:MAG: UDP-3-O-(3-hydroxymyristoyl)glucosamine N-acyltransferase [Granulosicoccus sp.]|nr:UDP-3-O-(3-hydroxymyristoyl)glucosamine N-acyltransferase [Granulosicoccus sp.]